MEIKRVITGLHTLPDVTLTLHLTFSRPYIEEFGMKQGPKEKLKTEKIVQKSLMDFASRYHIKMTFYTPGALPNSEFSCKLFTVKKGKLQRLLTMMV